jgi:DNA-binding NtrC family response regulator
VGSILIIDDEDKLRQLLARIIGLEGFQVWQAPDGRTALRMLDQHNPDVVLCDVKLPDANGVSLISEMKMRKPATEFILLTAYGNIPDGVRAIKNGAFEYLTKADDNDRIIPVLHQALKKAGENKLHIKSPEINKDAAFDSIMANAPALQDALQTARKVSSTSTTVLLTGETGTGKEIFAKAIHQAGPRSKKNFVAINCAAFGKDLLESEMFGYRAGAFTGAVKDRNGLAEEADGGTLFLDEVAEMPVELQAKLLRLLESGEFIKVGDQKPTKVDLRLIAATHQNLEEAIRNGTFREDLFYRLSVIQIQLPPLRERREDVILLAEYFLQLFSKKMSKVIPVLSQEVKEILLQYHWPGNIRELKNLVERCVVLADGNFVSVTDLPNSLQQTVTPAYSLSPSKTLSAFELASAEKLHIQKVLNYTGGNKTETARLLNIALTTLYRKLDEFGLRN